MVRISHRCREAQRIVYYKSDYDSFRKKGAYKILLDLALTIGVTPMSLGTVAEVWYKQYDYLLDFHHMLRGKPRCHCDIHLGTDWQTCIESP